MLPATSAAPSPICSPACSALSEADAAHQARQPGRASGGPQRPAGRGGGDAGPRAVQEALAGAFRADRHRRALRALPPGGARCRGRQGAYSRLKFESGGHRVQRVPQTEAQGRIHTSACTVAVLPEADALDEVVLNPAELRVDTFRASGAGGQHVNKTESAIRVTHLPTGIVVECQDSRSQHKNREKALGVLAARIRDKQLREQQAKTASTRKLLIGSGDRSGRIRTYNFPQGRVTDHRINLTLYKIDRIMDGELDELIGALSAEQKAEQLAQLAEEAA